MNPYFQSQSLFGYLDGSISSPSLLLTSSSTTSPTVLVVNPEYDVWYQQDQAILCVLISTISEYLLTLVVGLNTSYEVWATLQKNFASKASARVMNTRYQLATLKKGAISVPNYSTKAKDFVEILFTIGEQLQMDYHRIIILWLHL